MMMTFAETAKAISEAQLPLHIAGTEVMLRALPKGLWVGGSTEYFMSAQGGTVSGNRFFVTEFPYSFSAKAYGVSDIKNVAADAFDNGFSILIIPFDSAVQKEYAENAAGYRDMFMKNITGWISGVNLDIPSQTPIAVNGMTGEVFTDKAVALHLEVPQDKTVSMNIINILSQDESSPLIEFENVGFSATHCLVDGKKTVLADYIAKNKIDTKFPLVGDYSGSGVNISIKAIENGVVSFYAPVFSGIKYRMAKPVANYAKEFKARIAKLDNSNAVFSCNCILNFLYGELEGKNLEAFSGPITFGEIAYQLVNQTLVYVTVE